MKNDQFKLKVENGKEYIFDPIRKKYISLTTEEWVRQQIIAYLTQELHYPQALISVEKQIRVGAKFKRYDIVVYKHDLPWLIVECKNEKEKLSNQTLSQLLSYNSALTASYLSITNGKEIFTYDINLVTWNKGFPAYH